MDLLSPISVGWLFRKLKGETIRLVDLYSSYQLRGTKGAKDH